MKEFFTRQGANEGIRLDLFLLDGTKSEHFMQIRGMDSDEFHIAEMKAKRTAHRLAEIDSDTERAMAVMDAENECIAALIADWSFPQECTQKNKVDFLREAPQIAAEINKLAAKRSVFFKKKPSVSTAGSKTK